MKKKVISKKKYYLCSLIQKVYIYKLIVKL